MELRFWDGIERKDGIELRFSDGIEKKERCEIGKKSFFFIKFVVYDTNFTWCIYLNQKYDEST